MLNASNSRPTLLLAFAILAVQMAAIGRAFAAESAGPWLTGRALDQQLGQGAGINWSGVQLRSGLQNLAKAQQVAVLLDRRIDPDARANLVAEATLANVFGRIAEHNRLGYAQLGPLAYFGPPETSRILRTLAALRAEDLDDLPASAKKKWTHQQSWRWSDLATPRDLLEELAKEGGFRILDLERIPHDLWGAASLPPLSIGDRLTLVLAQFELTFSPSSDGRSARLVDLPSEIVLVRRYPGGGSPRQLAQRWSTRAPDAQVRVDGDEVVVEGRLEEHEALSAKPAATARPPKVTGSTQVYTLTVSEQPLGPVLKQLAAKLKLELIVRENDLAAAGISLDDPVSFRVSQASLDDLLTAVLSPAGLTFKRKGQRLEVFPARPP